MAFELDVMAFDVHGVDVHDAVAIGEEVDAILPDHGMCGCPSEVRGQGDGFVVAIEAPDILAHLPYSVLSRSTGENSG